MVLSPLTRIQLTSPITNVLLQICFTIAYGWAADEAAHIQLNFNILPDPIKCTNAPGGVNSVVADHAVGFLNAGHTINGGKVGPTIVHALAQAESIDVFHCHGLYPIGKGYFDGSYSYANTIVLRNALKAKVTVCISEFSANILRHKLHIDPIVTRNGIWTKDYQMAGSQSGPVLFPKAGLDANAKPDDMLYLKRESDLKLLSIANIPDVRSTGPLRREKFLEVLRSASIYLGTTKENNSMATMEAMISGVPVVGYDIGFNREWLTSGIGCELVPYGDQAALHEAIKRVHGNWSAYSAEARKYAERFDWVPVIDDLLALYEKVSRPAKPSVSIIIPSHNYGRYLGEAIESAINQTVPCEVIVIDDCSTDNSVEIAVRYRRNVKLIQNKKNVGVAQTRNIGIEAASGDFIVCLDADDKLYPNFVEKHLAAFRTNEDAIAYASINLVDASGNHANKTWFNKDAVPALQTNGKNQIPSCCMFRKIWWKKAGGYDGKFSPAEDANLWLKIFGLGGQAVRASKESLMDYRMHPGSLSSYGFGNFWSQNPFIFNVPVEDRDPDILVVIDGDEHLAKETLWSLEYQTYPNWACEMRTANGLKETFPWLNKMTNRSKSVITVKAGEVLPPDYLRSFKTQMPDWITQPRLR